MMICSLKPLFIQQFVQNFHLGVLNLEYYDYHAVPASVSCSNVKESITKHPTSLREFLRILLYFVASNVGIQ